MDFGEQWEVGEENHADINRGPADLSEVGQQM